MNSKAAVLLALALAVSGCSSTQNINFEKAYNESVVSKVEKAEGLEPETVTYTASDMAAVVDAKTEAAAAAAAVKTPGPAATAGIKDRSLSMAVETMAPTATATPYPKPKKKRFRVKEFDISSDSLTFNKETSITVFIGNVILLAEGVRLNCEKLVSKNYKDNADATGNVRAYYKAQKTLIKCGRIKYGNQMSTVEAYDGVITEKYLDKGNTITMYADQADFDTEYGTIVAKKIKKRVKVVYKEMVAFSEKVVYNDDTGIMELTGKPVVKKSGSSFTAVRIKVDTNKKTMKLENDIWSRVFYGDMKKAETEVKNETDKNPAPGKVIQQKTGGK